MEQEYNHRSQGEQTRMQQQPALALWGQYSQNSTIKAQPISTHRQTYQENKTVISLPINSEHNNRQQESRGLNIHIDINNNQKKFLNLSGNQIKDQNHKAYPASNLVAKNRRYTKLKILWKEGFFQQEHVMLKFPQFYFQYVGKFKKQGLLKKQFNGMAQFLQSQALRNEYRNLLEIQCPELPTQSSSQMQQQTEETQSPYEQPLQTLPPEQLELEEQALIDMLQLKFLSGQLEGFNYEEIDNDENLDIDKDRDRQLWKQRELDEQEKYFSQLKQEDQDNQQRDPSTNTGVQDF